MPSDSPAHQLDSRTSLFLPTSPSADAPRSRFSRLFFAASPHPSRSPSPSGHDILTLRALVSTKDAGVIIGKAGKNVADLREQTGVKAGVSKVIPGIHERVLTVTGSVDSVAKVRTPRSFFSPPFFTRFDILFI